MKDNKTMIQLVVGTEAMFFLALIMAFVYMAYNAGFEPHEVSKLNLKSTSFFTVVLLCSSLSLWLAERNYKKQNFKMLQVFLGLTIFLGCVFLFGQGREYVHLIRENITLGGSVFGTSFYALTGFHGFHVFIGLVILSIVLVLFLLGDFKKKPSSVLSTVSVYWHFVDVVWLFVFAIVYVLPQFTKL